MQGVILAEEIDSDSIDSYYSETSSGSESEEETDCIDGLPDYEMDITLTPPSPILKRYPLYYENLLNGSRVKLCKKRMPSPPSTFIKSGIETTSEESKVNRNRSKLEEKFVNTQAITEKRTISDGSNLLKRIRKNSDSMESSSVNGTAGQFVIQHNPRTLEKYQAYYNSRIPLGIGEEYLDWKNVIHLFYGDPISRLTAGFRIDLKTLGDSHYTIGAALKCSQVIERTPNSCPSCPDILGVVHVREDEAAYYFKVDSNLFQGGETVKLTPQFEMQLTDEIYLWVDDNYILSVHDTKRSNYTNVYNRNDIFLPYDTSLIFKAIVKSETELEVVDFSEDVKFKVFYNRTDDIWQFFYTDPIASKQRIYEYRAVDLHPLGGNKFILNFNFSYARFIAPKFKGFVNHLRKEVIAGVEYHLF